MSKRPTIADLARVSGVSIATVDRVLNARHAVREETARRVYAAAQEIGYHATSLIRQRAFEDRPHYRLGFLLQRQAQSFYQSLSHAIEDSATRLAAARITPQIEFVPALTPPIIVDRLKAMAATNHAIAVVAPDYPAVTAAVQELKEKGIPVFSLLSDFAAGVREGYVGLNNRKVGRTAAWMIARGARRAGKVACFVGNHRFHGHELREIGFRSYFREHAPDFEFLETLINLETPEITHEATINLLHKHPDLAGFYVCGGGMEGAISAIREEGYSGKLAVVVNELTQDSREALADEVVTAVISTPVRGVADELLSLMTDAIERGKSGLPGQSFLPFDLYISENI